MQVAPGVGKAIQAFDVAYFTASCDDAETNARFAKSLELDYPILSDPGKDVAKAYGVVHGAASPRTLDVLHRHGRQPAAR